MPHLRALRRILPYAGQPIIWRGVACLPTQQQQQLRSSPVRSAMTVQGARWSSSQSSSPSSSESPSSSTSSAPAHISPSPPSSPTEPRLSLTFTCTVPSCNSRRSSHTFTKRAYERGVVLVECPGCRNRHLIADHLGWFNDGTADGKYPTIEDMLRAKGERVVRGRLDGAGGVIEYLD